MTTNVLKERLDKGPVICAEGFLFEIERRGYMASGEFVPMVSLDHPEVLENLHREFQHAGSDVVEAFTYNVWKEDDKAAQLEVEKMFSEMIGWAVDEGADMLIGETFYYAEEAFKALEVMKKSGLPTVLTISPMGENKMRDGMSVVDTCKELEQRGADVVGLNCFRGPETMMPYLKEVRAAVKCHVGALPIPYRTSKEHPTFFNLPDYDNCGCPSPHGRTFPTALDPLFCNRYEIGKFAKEAYDLGIKYIGVCCGANPMLIRETAEAVGLKVPASKYRENMENHFMYGKNKRIPKHMTEYGDKA